jgi:predicted house-cleaning noncanonical NTP pyrophosphatase (MazG superfamily)
VRNTLTTLRLLSKSEIKEIARHEIADELQQAIQIISSNVIGDNEFLTNSNVNLSSRNEAVVAFGRVLVDFSNLLSDVSLRSLSQVMQADYEYLLGNSLTNVRQDFLNDHHKEKLLILSNQLSKIEASLGG